MKILFVNPPVVRSERSSAENDFAIEGRIVNPSFLKIPGVARLFKLLRVGKGIRYGVRAGSRWPFTMEDPMNYAPYPFVMGYAASYLKANGFEVNIIDAVAEGQFFYEKFLDDVKRENADIVVIEVSTPTIDIDLWIAKKVSEFTQVALAGTHLTSTAETLLNEYSNISYFLKGEYILSALKMAQTRTPGIYESDVVADVDLIPFPFRDYPAAINYYDPSMPTPRPQLAVMGSKGCPFKCTFCQWPQIMYDRKVSLRQPEMIAQEIREAIGKHSYKSIFFDDDTFNIGKERISKLSDELQKIGLPWTMMGRLDVSPEWLYDKMVDSGCVGMRFGIETFDHGVLKNVKKGIERKDFRAILEHITRKHPQLMIHLTMMKDMPGQTDEIHENDMKILKNLGYSVDNPRRSYQLSTCAPFPGTEMYNDLVKEHGKETMDEYSLYDGGKDTVMKKIKIIKAN